MFWTKVVRFHYFASSGLFVNIVCKISRLFQGTIAAVRKVANGSIERVFIVIPGRNSE